MKTQSELDPRIKVRAPLRCDGVGRLECAEDVESGERLAVRWFPLTANGAAAARALESMPAHPLLPRIRQTGQLGPNAYVAMSFPDGKLLSTLAAPLTPQKAARLGASIAEALAVLHAQQVVHGELSAESVLELEEGQYVLWDLPLVLVNRLTDRRREERAAHLLKGAAFLAPERARGGEPAPEGDLYSLATVLCVAVGMPLPEQLSPLAFVHHVATGKWRPWAPLGTPPPLMEALDRLLEDDPQARPDAATAASLLAAVAQELEAAPRGAARATSVERRALTVDAELPSSAEAVRQARLPLEVRMRHPSQPSEERAALNRKKTVEVPLPQLFADEARPPSPSLTKWGRAGTEPVLVPLPRLLGAEHAGDDLLKAVLPDVSGEHEVGELSDKALFAAGVLAPRPPASLAARSAPIFTPEEARALDALGPFEEPSLPPGITDPGLAADALEEPQAQTAVQRRRRIPLSEDDSSETVAEERPVDSTGEHEALPFRAEPTQGRYELPEPFRAERTEDAAAGAESSRAEPTQGRYVPAGAESSRTEPTQGRYVPAGAESSRTEPTQGRYAAPGAESSRTEPTQGRNEPAGAESTQGRNEPAGAESSRTEPTQGRFEGAGAPSAGPFASEPTQGRYEPAATEDGAQRRRAEEGAPGPAHDVSTEAQRRTAYAAADGDEERSDATRGAYLLADGFRGGEAPRDAAVAHEAWRGVAEEGRPAAPVVAEAERSVGLVPGFAQEAGGEAKQGASVTADEAEAALGLAEEATRGASVTGDRAEAALGVAEEARRGASLAGAEAAAALSSTDGERLEARRGADLAGDEVESPGLVDEARRRVATGDEAEAPGLADEARRRVATGDEAEAPGLADEAGHGVATGDEAEAALDSVAEGGGEARPVAAAGTAPGLADEVRAEDEATAGAFSFADLLEPDEAVAAHERAGRGESPPRGSRERLRSPAASEPAASDAAVTGEFEALAGRSDAPGSQGFAVRGRRLALGRRTAKKDEAFRAVPRDPEDLEAQGELPPAVTTSEYEVEPAELFRAAEAESFRDATFRSEGAGAARVEDDGFRRSTFRSEERFRFGATGEVASPWAEASGVTREDDELEEAFRRVTDEGEPVEAPFPASKRAPVGGAAFSDNESLQAVLSHRSRAVPVVPNDNESLQAVLSQRARPVTSPGQPTPESPRTRPVSSPGFAPARPPSFDAGERVRPVTSPGPFEPERARPLSSPGLLRGQRTSSPALPAQRASAPTLSAQRTSSPAVPRVSSPALPSAPQDALRARPLSSPGRSLRADSQETLSAIETETSAARPGPWEVKESHRQRPAVIPQGERETKESASLVRSDSGSSPSLAHTQSWAEPRRRSTIEDLKESELKAAGLSHRRFKRAAIALVIAALAGGAVWLLSLPGPESAATLMKKPPPGAKPSSPSPTAEPAPAQPPVRGSEADAPPPRGAAPAATGKPRAKRPPVEEEVAPAEELVDPPLPPDFGLPPPEPSANPDDLKRPRF